MSNDTLQYAVSLSIPIMKTSLIYIANAAFTGRRFSGAFQNPDQRHGSKVLAVLNVVDDTSIVQPGELGLSEQAFAQLNVGEGCLSR